MICELKFKNVEYHIYNMRMDHAKDRQTWGRIAAKQSQRFYCAAGRKFLFADILIGLIFNWPTIIKYLGMT